MPGTHFSLSLSEVEIAALLERAVDDLTRRAADRACQPLDGHDGGPTEALAHLHMLVHLQQAVERLADRAAEQAAEAGAGYPQLGRACNISRQGARRRWPGLVTAQPSRPTTHTDRSR
ncbi:hypothetical protein ACIQGZ_27705 [Streptomyces sp. NPDC092296]|uniref:hypothetical protein n=1 Tax=Streptomyces sp. NPDC092296 TaxID=3366012 RepID=UPI003814A194